MEPDKGKENSNADRGVYSNEEFVVHKKALLSVGGTMLDLAIAMQETSTLTASSYPYGDEYPDHTPKTEDAANFGIFKQGWGMLRTTVHRFKVFGPKHWNHGKLLNDRLDYDVAALHESLRKLGWEQWIAGHRGGQSGLDGTWPARDIRNYQSGVLWILDQLKQDKKYLTDGTKFWYKVPPV